ncbi:polysaccharide deacetylase family protein [Branchiibius cervicis]|uniref:Polysaccharide deacetylase family protein n=1 Tax=Branchiibius cervicis TaxID=908252 RepID=A0ABW2AU53_9MICO
MNWATSRVAELCFHGIGVPDRQLEPGEDRFWVDPSTFASILDAVRDFPSATISFDDSNVSDVIYALPGLERRDLRADFFVIAGRLDQRGSLGCEDVRELGRRGMRIGSHGMDHVSWRQVRSASSQEREYVLARRMLGDLTGTEVTAAAFPRGAYDRAAITTLRALGYEDLRIIDGGASSPDAWLRDRYSVTRFDTAESIAAYLASPDGGLAGRLQRTVKRGIKRWR